MSIVQNKTTTVSRTNVIKNENGEHVCTFYANLTPNAPYGNPTVSVINADLFTANKTDIDTAYQTFLSEVANMAQ